jgi:hypothetical protein
VPALKSMAVLPQMMVAACNPVGTPIDPKHAANPATARWIRVRRRAGCHLRGDVMALS